MFIQKGFGFVRYTILSNCVTSKHYLQVCVCRETCFGSFCPLNLVNTNFALFVEVIIYDNNLSSFSRKLLVADKVTSTIIK